MSARSVLALSTGALVLLVAATVGAAPFENDDLFFGRAVKQSRETRVVEGGVRFEIAPVRAISKEAMGEFRAEHPELDPVFEYLQRVDPAVLADASAEGLRDALLALPGLTSGDRAAIDTAFPEGAASADVQRAVDAVHLLAPVLTEDEEAVSFALAPYVIVNLAPIAIALEVPMAGFVAGGDTDFTLANANLDLRFGHTFGESIPVGLSYGFHSWFPTGGERADSLALANLLAAPRYLHQSLSFEPYVVGGVDFGFLYLQAHLGLVTLVPVREGPREDTSLLLGYGVSLVLQGWGIVALNVELAGAANLASAGDLATLSLGIGPRLNVFGFKLAAAVQIPFAVGEKRTYSTFGGAGVASPADINVVVSTGFAY